MSLSIGRWKLEKGNKPTDWSPAPEDTPQYRVVTTSYSYTLAQWLAYAAEGYTASWSTGTSGQGVRVGDTVMLKGTNSNNGSAVYVLMTVNTLNTSGAIANATSHGLIDPTAGQRADSAQSTANAAAPKASAVKRTQRIWYRTNGSSAPSTPGTASSNWVTKANDGNDAWTKMHIAISSTHKYIYTCEQYEMANGTVGYTSVLLDNTITVIDGGNLITGSVKANTLDAADINASKTLTVGAMTDAAASTILNSNIEIGGRNLLLDTSTGQGWYYSTFDASTGEFTSATTAITESYVTAPLKAYVEQGQQYILSVYAKSNGYVKNMDLFKYNANTAHIQSKLAISLTTEYKLYTMTFTANATEQVTIRFDNNGSTTSGTNAILYIKRPKLEKGNKATDWSPAPEDTQASIDSNVGEVNASLAATEESLSQQIQDTNDGLSSVSATVTQLNTIVQQDRADIGRWLNFNESDGLTIGKAGSQFKVVTDETRQAFMYGNETLAYTSGDRFVAPRMEADELHIGNWMWVKRDNGNLSLKWIG
jgi:hypothetical protein